MPYQNRKGALRLKIESFLATQSGPVTAAEIQQNTKIESKKVYRTLYSMRLDGQIEVDGVSPRKTYRLINLNQSAKQPIPPKQAAWSNSQKVLRSAAPKPNAEIIYPPDYRHTVGSAPNHGTYTGADWTSRTLRPGCLDGERIASRRGDDLVQHRTPLGMQTGNQRGTAYHRVPAITEEA